MKTDKKRKVVLISGDGIGPEITEAATEVLEATGAQIEWVPAVAGETALQKGLDFVPQQTLDLIAEHGVALKGPIATPIAKGHSSANVMMRRHFQLFANVRPVRSLPGVPSRYENVDVVIVRENTEDLYSGIEHEILPGVVESIKVITAEASERVAKFTFDYCRIHNRKKVSAVHKANIMKKSDGLFLKSIRKVHQDYPDITYDEVIVDNLCHQLVIRPEQYDVLLCQNLNGDIVSDLCAGLVGGLGVVPGSNYGKNCAIFEAVHGTAPDIAGMGIANPSAMLMSSRLMLEHLGFREAAKKLGNTLERVLSQGGAGLTKDLGGQASTKEFTKQIIEQF